jgi:hypothetical protein
MDTAIKRLLWIVAVGVWLNFILMLGFGVSNIYDSRLVWRVATTAAKACSDISDGFCTNSKIC